MFESLTVQSVRTYAWAADARVGHLRTKNTEHEVDLIVEGADRSVVAIEVKLSDTIGQSDVRHLNWLHDQLGDRLVNRVVINTGPYAYRRPDGVAVVPLACSGPEPVALRSHSPEARVDRASHSAAAGRPKSRPAYW
ncbi:MAG: DUF4143 domain-containing protein [Micropruina sp.]|nr:DUF4143 domain-containing protein [Micropruina sp.]